ncbi:MAG: hypothetical protein ABJJ69_00140 [Paracoccaceae bacterium]
MRNLLDLLQQKTVSIALIPHRVLSLNEVATRLRCKSSEIIALILADRLETVFGNVQDDGISGIRVDLNEVRYALPSWEMPGTTRSKASTTLRVTYQTINYLVAHGMLESERMRNPKSRQYLDGICEGSVEAFLREYDTLGLMARKYRRPSGPFGCHLEAKGICPIESPQGISWIYERRSLAARLRKIGIHIPTKARPGAE